MSAVKTRGSRLYYILLAIAFGVLIANLAPAGRVRTIVASQAEGGGPGGPLAGGTTGPGGASPGATAGPGVLGPGALARGPGSGAGSFTVRGVSPTKIRIGIGIPDIGVVKALGPDYDVGNPREQMESVLKGWKDRGLVPVNGRDVEFYYRSYDIVGTQQQRAACEGWATDDKVFAVFAVSNFWAQASCLVRDYRIPLISSDVYDEGTFRTGGGRLFTLSPSYERMFRNWMHWAHRRGLLQGKKIGLYYGAAADQRAIINSSLKPELVRLGYGDQIVSEVTSSNVALGSPEDTVAADKFCAAGVDMAILVVSALNQTNFMYEADSQGCKPDYIENDFLFSTNDTAAHTFPPSQADGIYGMTSFRFGEVSAGMGLSGPGRACQDNYEKYSGKHVDARKAPAEWLFMEEGCDGATVLLKALQRAGRTLTEASFFDAMNATTNEVMGAMTNVTLRPGKRGGQDTQRTVQWHADCKCWIAMGKFEPFYVP